MRRNELGFAGWPGGARVLAPELFEKRHAQVTRQFRFLLRVLTPRTVFMEIGPIDCELSRRIAGYVERVWCVEAATGAARAPCNLRCGPMGGVPLRSIDIAFSERIENVADIWRLLKPGGVWFVHGNAAPAGVLRRVGFSRVQYYAGRFPVPGSIARISRHASTAAYK